MEKRDMSRPDRSRGRSRRTGRAAPEHVSLLESLGIDLSWPVVILTLLVLVFGFGPLLLIDVFSTEGLGRKVLAAAGPVLVCLAFALMSYFYGMRAGMSRNYVWGVVTMFVVLALLAGWGLFVSV